MRLGNHEECKRNATGSEGSSMTYGCSVSGFRVRSAVSAIRIKMCVLIIDEWNYVC